MKIEELLEELVSVYYIYRCIKNHSTINKARDEYVVKKAYLVQHFSALTKQVEELGEGTAILNSTVATKDRDIERLTDKLEKAEKKNEMLKKQYYELIMQVGQKFPNETRHETALRYIRNAEKGGDSCAKEKRMERV